MSTGADVARTSTVVALRVADGVGQAVLLGGAVAGVSALIHRGGAVPALGWLVALAAVGFTGVALWEALCARDGAWDGAGVARAGGWLTVLLVTHTLAFTDLDLLCVVALLLLPSVALHVAVGGERPAPCPQW